MRTYFEVKVNLYIYTPHEAHFYSCIVLRVVIASSESVRLYRSDGGKGASVISPGGVAWWGYVMRGTWPRRATSQPIEWLRVHQEIDGTFVCHTFQSKSENKRLTAGRRGVVSRRRTGPCSFVLLFFLFKWTGFEQRRRIQEVAHKSK